MRFSILVILLFGLVQSIRFFDPVTRGSNRVEFEEDAAVTVNMNYTTYWFEVPLDHFAYASNATMKIRYCVNMDNYKPGGPIFFYAGNEGSIEDFIKATGIMWDIAAQFNAALIFAEHRYYGKSYAFGKDLDFKDVQHMSFLTSAQALADYAKLIYFLKQKNGHDADKSPSFSADTKIVAFGGSYGGMLAAWFRMKYPHLVVGAWASSAPLKYIHNGGIDWGVFDDITTRTFTQSGANPNNVKNGWIAIRNLAQTDDGRKYLNTLFKVAQKSLIKTGKDGDNLVNYVREAIEYMAMVDYPYPSNFLTPMPGFPVKAAAQFLAGQDEKDDRKLADMLNKASLVYYNYKNASDYEACIDPAVCGDPGTAQLGGALGWPWQECTEIVMEMCARNTSFFWDECGKDPVELLYKTCDVTFTQYGWTRAMMRIDAVRNYYGLDVTAYSNIILTQGHLDPWSGGGYKATDPGVNGPSGIYVMEIPGSAHHLDLRTPNKCDGDPTLNARYQIVNILKCWLTTGCANPTLTPLPPLNDISNVKCEDWIQGYPWGQDPPTTTPASTATATPTSESSSDAPLHSSVPPASGSSIDPSIDPTASSSESQSTTSSGMEATTKAGVSRFTLESLAVLLASRILF